MNNKAGVIAIGSGYVLAGKRTYRVTIPGRGGQVSNPQDCIDPVVVACYVVVRLQSIVNREIDPNETAVITCGTVRAGDGPNVIPDSAELTIDIRAYSSEVPAKAVAAVKRIVKAECQASGLEDEPDIREIEHVPPLVNIPEAVKCQEQQFKDSFGSRMVQCLKPNMASDDFSVLAPKGVHYIYWTIGCIDPDVWDGYEREGRLDQLPANNSPLSAPALELTLRAAIDAWSIGALMLLAVV